MHGASCLSSVLCAISYPICYLYRHSYSSQGADLKQQDSVVSVVSVVRDCEQLPAKTTEATKNNRVQRRKRPKQPENNRPNGENNRNNSPAVFSRSPRLFLLFYGPRCFRLAPGAASCHWHILSQQPAQLALRWSRLSTPRGGPAATSPAPPSRLNFPSSARVR